MDPGVEPWWPKVKTPVLPLYHQNPQQSRNGGGCAITKDPF